jgi:hypothetical protein
MAQGEYELAFYGKIVEGTSLDKVKGHVAQLFKANSEQVARMFTGNRVVIRNKLDDDTALKYIVAMKKRGAVCQIEKMGQPGVEVNLGNTASPKPVERSIPKKVSSTEPASIHRKQAQPQPSTESQSITTNTAPKKVEMANPNALPIAGEKVDEILSHTHFELGATGLRLSEEHEEIFPEHHELDDVTLAPTGSDLNDKKEEIQTAIPDISHLSLKQD